MGDNRDCWILAAGSTTPEALQMLNFLGVLLGLALRTGELLPLDWPAFVWKRLVGEDRVPADIRSVDVCTDLVVHSLQEDLSLVSTLDWSYPSIDGLQRPLRPGCQGLVAVEDAEQFQEALLHSRLRYDEAGILALRSGFASVVPVDLISLWTWQELERAVCGDRGVDINALKANTKYTDCSSTDASIVMFWEVLETFSSSERAELIRFTWGRTRLPTEQSWEQKFTITLTHHSDTHLPVSHTCFFALDLPRYSTADIMAQKLRHAMMSCMTIDADHNVGRGGVDWDEDHFSDDE